jgi:hypothetical protein
MIIFDTESFVLATGKYIWFDLFNLTFRLDTVSNLFIINTKFDVIRFPYVRLRDNSCLKRGVDGSLHFTVPSMNRLNQTEAATFSNFAVMDFLYGFLLSLVLKLMQVTFFQSLLSLQSL